MQLTHLNFAKGFRGGERQTQLLLEQLSELGYRQKLFVRKNSKLTQRCKKIQNLEIIEINKPYIFHIMQIRGATILHAHETKAAQFAFFANLLLKIPYIITRRVDNPIKNNFLNKKIYENALCVVSLSRAIQNEVLAVAPNVKRLIIPSAYTNALCDSNKINTIKERFKGKYLIGNVGALDDKHKGQSHLIEVAKSVEHSHPDMHFIFVGDGQDAQKLKMQAKELSNVSFEGFVENVNDYICCFNLFVFPSNNEGLGSILLDVMQLEIPIIASSVGGIIDIIEDNYNGLLVPPKNPEALKKSIIKLYKNPILAKELASNAKKNIQNYSARNMALSYQKIYNEV